MPASRQANDTDLPCANATSISRSFATICSGVNTFLAILSSLVPGKFSLSPWIKKSRSGQTQRVNLNSLLQSLSVTVGSYVQSFHLGSASGAVTVTRVTPPTDYYESYAIKLAVPSSYYNTFQNVEIAGLNTSGDATA